MTDGGMGLIEWVAQFGVTAGVLVFVLLRLEKRMETLDTTLVAFVAWQKAWVTAHAKARGVEIPE